MKPYLIFTLVVTFLGIVHAQETISPFASNGTDSSSSPPVVYGYVHSGATGTWVGGSILWEACVNATHWVPFDFAGDWKLSFVRISGYTPDGVDINNDDSYGSWVGDISKPPTGIITRNGEPLDIATQGEVDKNDLQTGVFKIVGDGFTMEDNLRVRYIGNIKEEDIKRKYLFGAKVAAIFIDYNATRLPLTRYFIQEYAPINITVDWGQYVTLDPVIPGPNSTTVSSSSSTVSDDYSITVNLTTSETSTSSHNTESSSSTVSTSDGWGGVLAKSDHSTVFFSLLATMLFFIQL